MKWGIRRYQNYNRTRIKQAGDIYIKKNSTLSRYTNLEKESEGAFDEKKRSDPSYADKLDDTSRNYLDQFNTLCNAYIGANKNKILDEYKVKGYDAIVDPEDYLALYETPMILISDEKFRLKSLTLVKRINRTPKIPPLL